MRSWMERNSVNLAPRKSLHCLELHAAQIYERDLAWRSGARFNDPGAFYGQQTAPRSGRSTHWNSFFPRLTLSVLLHWSEFDKWPNIPGRIDLILRLGHFVSRFLQRHFSLRNATTDQVGKIFSARRLQLQQRDSLSHVNRRSNMTPPTSRQVLLGQVSYLPRFEKQAGGKLRVRVLLFYSFVVIFFQGE